jgi:DNA-binding transcriptional ArsR family regulator
VDPFPEDVKQFLDANIESVEQLEILRILGDNPHQEWSVVALAREVQAKPQTIAAHLAALQARGLLTIEVRGTEAVSRSGPSTPEREVLVQRLLELYRQRPVTMINLVYARARDALRTFAEAFRLRKEE